MYFYTEIFNTNKRIYSYCALLLLLLCNSAYAYTIEKGGCYTIDGPANVRDKPSGKVIASLENGISVKVIEDNDKWYLIEYAENNVKPGCEFSGKTARAWTHYSNLVLPATSLSELVRSGRVNYSTSEVDLHGYESASFLGNEYKFNCDTEEGGGCHLNISLPFEVNEYCLNGGNQRNRILKVYYEYGGDAGAWITDIKYEKPLLKGECIIVNGTIAPQINLIKSKMMDVCGQCDDSRKRFSSYRMSSIECAMHVGDFNKDGYKEALIHFQLNAAPSLETYELYQMDETCQGIPLGRIFIMSVP